MKRKMIASVMICGAVLLAGCTEKAAVDMNFGEDHTVNSDALAKYSSLTWATNDESIAAVENGTITGKGPGTAVITASDEKGKVVGEYTVNVNVVPVSNIVLSTNSTEITVGRKFSLSYTLFPDNASDYGINWKSADESVATVDEQGQIKALKIGQTTISASNTDGVMATCSVTVKKAPPNFSIIFSDYCSSSWASWGSDYLTIDTNPRDKDDYIDFDAYYAIEKVNKELGIPGHVYEDMGNTSAMQGRQTYTGDGLTVSWSYHSDHGMEVTYSYTGD